MPKHDGAEYATSLPTSEIKRLLREVLDGSVMETLNQGALDDEAEIAILARRVGGMLMQKSPYGPGLAAIHVIVTEHGSERRVEVVSLGSSFADGMRNARGSSGFLDGAQKSKQNLPKLPMSKKMASAVVEALRSADRGLRQVG